MLAYRNGTIWTRFLAANKACNNDVLFLALETVNRIGRNVERFKATAATSLFDLTTHIVYSQLIETDHTNRHLLMFSVAKLNIGVINLAQKGDYNILFQEIAGRC